MSNNQPEHQPPDQVAAHDTLVMPLDALDHTLLPLVGGKGAHLGELIRAGFSVPAGFCVTTTAYARVSASAGLDALLAELRAIPPTDTARQAELATVVRATILRTPVASDITSAMREAYRALGQDAAVSVAVRSSATAEDLPSASFAGQQETFLNLVGAEAVLDAVRRCWASLWTDRAVSYRAHQGIDPAAVRLAVVVQLMVDAKVAGVVFTANPLTGKRQQAVIDANPGLGEAVVSGATTPDHFVVNTQTGEILEHRLGDKHLVIRATAGGGTERIEQQAQHTACLADSQVRALATLGGKVEAQVGTPQDIEWALDASDQFWLLQARPITTLFPLPTDAPATDEVLRVYLSFTVQQGTYQPFTPMGISAIRLLASAITTLMGFPPQNPLYGPSFVTEAASRVYLDVTGALRSSFGRTVLSNMMAQAEVHAVAIFEHLSTEPRLSLGKARRLPLVLAIMRVFSRLRLPWYFLQTLARPAAAQRRLLQLTRTLHDAANVQLTADPRSRVAAVEQLFFTTLLRLLSGTAPVMIGGMGTFTLAGKLLGNLATEDEFQIILRGLPGNPTSEMTLVQAIANPLRVLPVLSEAITQRRISASQRGEMLHFVQHDIPDHIYDSLYLVLWKLAQTIQADQQVTTLVQNTPPAQLTAAYRTSSLPAALQHGLEQFLATYGHRSVNELDIGVTRWSEDPTYVFSVLASYLQLSDATQAPDKQFQRSAKEAEAMLIELTRRARSASRLRGLLVGFVLSRARALGGLREMPRYSIALLLAKARALLVPVGDALVQAGRLDQASDIFFLSFPEVYTALDGADYRSIVRERRARYTKEGARRRVPLVLLSDGTEPAVVSAMLAAGEGQLRGTPASPGRVTAPARVILDPHNAQLAHGEILVAPSTDPGWTPLFLTAGGLVMEMGGAMSHGAIVAREYGIPAVVGVADAIERIRTGQLVSVDGTTGTITLADEPETSECADAETTQSQT